MNYNHPGTVKLLVFWHDVSACRWQIRQLAGVHSAWVVFTQLAAETVGAKGYGGPLSRSNTRAMKLTKVHKIQHPITNFRSMTWVKMCSVSSDKLSCYVTDNYSKSKKTCVSLSYATIRFTHNETTTFPHFGCGGNLAHAHIVTTNWLIKHSRSF